MKIYVIGSTGQLGSDIADVLSKKHFVEGGGKESFDVRNTDEFLKYIKNRYDVIINCSAYLDVPGAENNISEAFYLNSIVPSKLAEFCNENGIIFVHFSTDYVFDGMKRTPYVETDVCRPLNIYGLSKYTGEKSISALCKRSVIMRVSGLYGHVVSRAKGYNFISMFLSNAKKSDCVNVVADEILTPTFTGNVAEQLNHILDIGIFGLFHSTDEGEVSWHDFACEIKRALKLKVEIKGIKSTADHLKRPKYSVLENSVLKNHSANIMKPWKETLNAFLRREYC